VLQASVAPLFESSFRLPKRGDFSDAQAAFPSEIHELLCLDNDGVWRDANNRIWVPTSALELQLRLCTLAHMGSSGHRGFFATLEKLENSVFWTGMEEDIRSFVKTCLHCESTLGRGMIPCPLGEALHAESPN
jgi:Integrase zinc binding domain